MAPLDLFERWRARNRPHGRHEWNEHTLAPGVVVAYERNVETNARLEEAGVEVFRISGSERGGPRCMCCPVARDAP